MVDDIGNLEYDSEVKIYSVMLQRPSYTLARIYNPEGYVTAVTNPVYHYFRKDHLGNNREVCQAPPSGGWGASATIQRTQYYPSGLPWADGLNPAAQNKKYNGKEFVEAHGYDETDLGNRGLHHAKDRFDTMDRFCEKYPWQSPYVFAANNPVNYIDVNGDSIYTSIVDNKTNQLSIYVLTVDKNGNYGFVNVSNRSAYTMGSDNFVDKLSNAITDIASGEGGNEMVNNLLSDKSQITIYDTRNINKKQGENFSSGLDIGWNPDNTKGGTDEKGKTNRPSFVGLAHEMGHVESNINGTSNNINWNGKTNISNDEIPALHRENQVRAEHSLTLRNFYDPKDKATRVIQKYTRLSMYYTVGTSVKLPYPYISK